MSFAPIRSGLASRGPDTALHFYFKLLGPGLCLAFPIKGSHLKWVAFLGTRACQPMTLPSLSLRERMDAMDLLLLACKQVEQKWSEKAIWSAIHYCNILFYMVGTAGFEPATHGLKGRCSTD